MNAIRHCYGPWTAHNICLADTLYTMDQDTIGGGLRLRSALQSAVNLCGTIASKRILDLGCNEGLFGIECALQGATDVLGIDGRAQHLSKAEFAASALKLTERVRFLQDDVRSLSPDIHGRFDLVFCMGLLYHLPKSDILPFLRSLSSVCTDVTIIDTHIALHASDSLRDGATGYEGCRFEEPKNAADEPSGWSSLDGQDSFWLTKPSLVKALTAVGFHSVFEILAPSLPSPFGESRVMLAACRKPRIRLYSPSEHLRS